MARPERLELPTPRFEAWCSIQLSYGRVCGSLPQTAEQSTIARHEIAVRFRVRTQRIQSEGVARAMLFGMNIRRMLKRASRLFSGSLVCLTVVAGTPAAMAAFQISAWEELTPMPVPRSEMPAAAIADRIYVPGGLGGTDRLAALDTVDGRWHELARLPGGRHHAALAASDNRLYLFGGGDPRWQASDTAWRYDPGSNRWVALTPMPEPRYAAAAVALGGELYVAGGDGPTGALLRYSPKTDTWTRLADARQRREHTAAAVLNGKIHLIGGRWGGVGELSSTEIYDPQTNTWTEGPSLNTARGGFSAVSIGGGILAAGGEVIFSGRKTLHTIEFLSPDTEAWRVIGDLPLALHGVPLAIIGADLYVLGGSEAAGGIENRGRVFRASWRTQ